MDKQELLKQYEDICYEYGGISADPTEQAKIIAVLKHEALEKEKRYSEGLLKELNKYRYGTPHIQQKTRGDRR